MKINKGTKLYRLNKKTHNMEVFTIVDAQYVFDRKIGSRSNYTAEEINELIKEGTLRENVDDVLQDAIHKLEHQFKVKLEVKK